MSVKVCFLCIVSLIEVFRLKQCLDIVVEKIHTIE